VVAPEHEEILGIPGLGLGLRVKGLGSMKKFSGYLEVATRERVVDQHEC
jgi:hypothetical protein